MFHLLTQFIPRNITFSLILSLCFAVCSCTDKDIPKIKDNVSRSLSQKLGTTFTTVQQKHYSLPNINKLNIPTSPKMTAIWGASGRDDQGNIYFGVSSHARKNSSALIYQYNPVKNTFIQQGNVLNELKKSDLYEEGMSQNKIHSKFYEAEDGYLYFTSFDEKGESIKSGTFPTFGGHLWRKKPDDKNWQHLLATKEALIALNTDGRYIYALGYWGHVLYQYDVRNGNISSIKLDSFRKHVSRNFLIGQNGHIFVPNVQQESTESTESVIVKLQQYNQQLELVNTFPLKHYLNPSKFSQHGIVSYAMMKNGDLYFITGQGALYRLALTSDNTYKLSFEIFMDEFEEKGSYIASLFSLNGKNFLVALGKQKSVQGYSWLVYETKNKVLASYPIENINSKTLLYGSVTRDNQGNMYVVGTDRSDRKQHKPIVLKIEY